MADQIRIAVVDEHPLFRHGVVRTIGCDAQMVVVAEGCTVQDARDIVARTEIDILLFDICLSEGGLAAAQSLLAARSGMRVVVLTASDSEEHLANAIRAGAAGYILKGVSGNELRSAIQAIHRGEPYITPALASRILMHAKVELLITSKGTEAERMGISLTLREQQLLGHVSQGLTNMEIAAKLGVSIPALKHSVSGLFKKIRVRNRMEAVGLAQRLNLI
jgi:DNA-binding NarL/FixJ family response regulator